MGRMVAYCGIDCTTCEEHLVIMSDSEDERRELLEYWREEYPDITMASVTCYGCREQGSRHFFLCDKCKIRTCAIKRKVETCADCPDYPCKLLEHHLALFPVARKNLEMIRNSFEDEQVSSAQQ